MINITQNYFTKNWIHYNEQTTTGSIIYLDNPGMIIIQSSLFSNNIGVLGACIYYNEISQISYLKIKGCNFTMNIGFIAGGVLFLNTLYNHLNLTNRNFYLENLAQDYGNVATTNPFRVILKTKPNFKTRKIFNLRIISGMTIPKLEFQLLDYFDQEMINFNGGIATLSLKNSNNWTANYDSSIILNGKFVVSIVNGESFSYFFFLNKLCFSSRIIFF